jgi:hypothetical protein
LHGEAVGSDNRAVGCEAECAVSGVPCGAVGQGDLEVALALNCHVQRIAGLGQRTLLMDRVNRRRFDAESDLRAGRNEASGVGTVRSDAPQILIHQVLKLGPLSLVSGGAQIGDVVGYDFDVRVLGLHARARDIKRPHWSDVPLHQGQAPVPSVLSIVDRMRSSSA